MPDLDLNTYVRRGNVELGSESPEEMKARLEREGREHDRQQKEAFILFRVVLFGLVIIALVAFAAAMFPSWFGLNAGSQAWAQGVASSVITGGLGFLTGRATK